jgi:hypothetical protein
MPKSQYCNSAKSTENTNSPSVPNHEADEDEDGCLYPLRLNKWNCRVQHGEDGRQNERRDRKWLGDGSWRMAKSLKEFCKKIQRSKSKHHEDE